MFKRTLVKSVAGAAVAGGTLAVAQLAGPAVVTASVQDVSYANSVETSTHLTLARTTVRPGQADVARVRVRSGAGTPHGSVTFGVAGRRYTVRVRAGVASHTLPSHLDPGHRYTVHAWFDGSGVYKNSSDTATLTVAPARHRRHHRHHRAQVLGTQAFASTGGGGGAATQAGTQAGTQVVASPAADGVLPATGANSSTELFGALGLAFVVAGGGSLVWYRRRAQA